MDRKGVPLGSLSQSARTIKGPTSMTQTSGICQVDDKAVISWYPGGRHMPEHSGTKGCVYKHTVWHMSNMHTKTHKQL